MFEDGHAIVVGTGRDIPNSERDAQAIAEILSSPNKGAYPESQVHLLTGSRATRAAILDTLERVYTQTRTSTGITFFFYFSGHGKQVKHSSARTAYYLLPWDYNAAAFAETCVSGEELLRWIKAMSFVQKMCLIFDCCHAGGLSRLKAPLDLPVSSFPMPPRLPEVLASGVGRVALASCRADETSTIGDRHSIFTEALLEALNGHDVTVTNEHLIRVLDLFTYVSRIVPKRTNGFQNPILNVSDLQDNFAVAYRPGVASSVAGRLQQQPERDSVSEEQVKTWQSMLANHKDNLLLIEQRMSEFVTSARIPLQYKREKRLKEKAIADLEMRIRRHQKGICQDDLPRDISDRSRA